jgi:hypothetical protein
MVKNRKRARMIKRRRYTERLKGKDKERERK